MIRLLVFCIRAGTGAVAAILDVLGISVLALPTAAWAAPPFTTDDANNRT
jgi:hypothetical protein